MIKAAPDDREEDAREAARAVEDLVIRVDVAMIQLRPCVSIALVSRW
jgi:hypothetical protein